MKESHRGSVIEIKKGIKPPLEVRINGMVHFLSKDFTISTS